MIEHQLIVTCSNDEGMVLVYRIENLGEMWNSCVESRHEKRHHQSNVLLLWMEFEESVGDGSLYYRCS